MWREQKQTIYFERTKLDIIAGLNESIEIWCTKHGCDKNLLNEWKLNLI